MKHSKMSFREPGGRNSVKCLTPRLWARTDDRQHRRTDRRTYYFWGSLHNGPFGQLFNVIWRVGYYFTTLGRYTTVIATQSSWRGSNSSASWLELSLTLVKPGIWTWLYAPVVSHLSYPSISGYIVQCFVRFEFPKFKCDENLEICLENTLPKAANFFKE